MAAGMNTIVRATGRPRLGDADAITIVAAHYQRHTGRIAIEFNNGFAIAFRARDVQGLEEVRADQLKEIQISPTGLSLHFPALDADMSIFTIIKGMLGGSSKWVANVSYRRGRPKRPPRDRRQLLSGARESLSEESCELRSDLEVVETARRA